jgi:hypothetical protein
MPHGRTFGAGSLQPDTLLCDADGERALLTRSRVLRPGVMMPPTTSAPAPTASPVLDEYLTVTRFARRLRVTRQWARRLASSGKVRALHTPYGWLIERASAEELAEQRAVAQQSRARRARNAP